MPDPIAATLPAPPAAGAPTPTPAATAIGRTDPRLPEGVVLKDSLNADIDRYFADEPASPPVVAPVVAPAAPVPPVPGSVAAKLAAARSASTVPPAAPTPPASPATDDPVAKAEAEMRAHNPKWKPSDGWNVVKTRLKTESDRAAALEVELTATKAKLTAPAVAGVSPQEIEDLRAREKAANDRLMVMDLESHPSFKAQFVEPKNAEIARASELFAAHGVKVDIPGILAKPRAEIGKAVSEVLQNVPEFDRVEIADAIRKAYGIEQSARAALGQSKELAKALQTQSVERQRGAFAKRWAPVSAAIGEFAQPVESAADATPEQRAADAEYNRDLSSLKEKAEAIALAPTTDEAVAENAIKAAAYDLHIQRVLPRVVSEYDQLVQLNQQLVAEVRALRGRNPNHGIKAFPVGGDVAASDPNKMDHASAAAHFFNKTG